MELSCIESKMCEDIFQCGQCKLAFTSLAMFFNHKREPCAPLSWSVPNTSASDAVPVLDVYDEAYDQQIRTVSTSKNQLENHKPYGRHAFNNYSMQQCTSFEADEIFNANVEEKQDLSCLRCQKSFKKGANLSVHLRTHEGDKPFQCPLCGRCFSQNTHLQNHLSTHKVWPDGLSQTVPSVNTTPSSYSCSYCHLVLPDYSKFRGHLKEHISQKQFKCIQGGCSSLFQELESLLDHVVTVHHEQSYGCNLCDDIFSSLEDISKHQQNHPKESRMKTKSKFKCLHCDASFTTLEKLTFHAATHNHLRMCSRCDKTFCSEKRLRSHLRTHEKVRPFQCLTCGASFRLKKYLKTHILRHGERSHVCTQCSMTFKRKDLLDRHLKIHQTGKLFDCPFKQQLDCKLVFSRKDKLNLHIKSHVKKLTSGKSKSRKSNNMNTSGGIKNISSIE